MLLLLAVAVGLAPGTWVRTETTTRDYDAPLRLKALDIDGAGQGGMMLTGAWHLTSANDHLGGYSALIELPDGNLLAGSDRGRLLAIPLKDGRPDASSARFSFLPGRGEKKRELVDLEALTIDPATGAIWAAYESSNAIERLGANDAEGRRRPGEMRGWASNSGPETMVRLPDGRFLVLAEGPEEAGRTNRPGYLFDRDPVDENAQSTAFRITTPRKFAPVDATLLPDGDVLILLRRVEYAFPVNFYTKIMRADPSQIEEGGEWTGEVVMELSDPALFDNFEGIEFVPDEAGSDSGSVYLISDDNVSAFQRTLMLRFAWPPLPREEADQAKKKAREE
ncbi:MAG: esterase-like activity of phytase family protein [Pseudomonadota bacterium]